MTFIVGLTDAQLRASAPNVNVTNASLAVTGAFFQTTQPVSGTVTVGNASLAVTGAFYQATQPVSIAATVAISAASLPLPTGAATETTLAALNTKVTAVNTGAVTISAALPTGANVIGGVTVADVTSTGTLAAPAQTVSLSVAGGMNAATAQITGTWAGIIQFEGTVDGTNWVPINGVYAGGTAPGPTISANGVVRLTPGGLASIRLNMTAWTSGTATITLRASRGTGGTFLNQSLPIGANVVGKVSIDQTTPGTTNLVQISGTVPVSGTFWQATQPVSIATMPSTPVTGTFWQATQPISGTVTINAIPTGANTIGNVGLVAGAAVIGAVTQSGTWNVGTITTLPALATGANVIGALTANQSVNNAQIGGVAPLMGNGVTGTGSQRVTIASDNTPFTVNATPTTPTASIITSAATTNATSIKASAGTLYSITCSNAGAAAVFVKLYNLAAAPTVGTSSIALTIPIAASSVVTIPLGAQGMRFGTGIALAITNLVTEADATAVAANQVKVLTSYI